MGKNYLKLNDIKAYKIALKESFDWNEKSKVRKLITDKQCHHIRGILILIFVFFWQKFNCVVIKYPVNPVILSKIFWLVHVRELQKLPQELNQLIYFTNQKPTI